MVPTTNGLHRQDAQPRCTRRCPIASGTGPLTCTNARTEGVAKTGTPCGTTCGRRGCKTRPPSGSARSRQAGAPRSQARIDSSENVANAAGRACMPSDQHWPEDWPPTPLWPEPPDTTAWARWAGAPVHRAPNQLSGWIENLPIGSRGQSVRRLRSACNRAPEPSVVDSRDRL